MRIRTRPSSEQKPHVVLGDRREYEGKDGERQLASKHNYRFVKGVIVGN